MKIEFSGSCRKVSIGYSFMCFSVSELNTRKSFMCSMSFNPIPWLPFLFSWFGRMTQTIKWITINAWPRLQVSHEGIVILYFSATGFLVRKRERDVIIQRIWEDPSVVVNLVVNLHTHFFLIWSLSISLHAAVFHCERRGWRRNWRRNSRLNLRRLFCRDAKKLGLQ